MANPTEHVFYCDESGASGGNLVDLDQPLYVAGGFLVPRTAERSIKQIVDDLAREQNVPELKAALLLKRESGEAAIDLALRGACKAGAMPFYLISEKRHNLAQKIVDVLMDPAHNPAAEWLPLVDDDKREQVANRLLGLPDAVLEQFATAYRNPDFEVWKAAIERLEINSRLLGRGDIADTLQGALTHLAEILDAENYARKHRLPEERRQHYEYTAICLPYFLHVIHLVDGALEAANLTGRVVHDEVPKFQRVYAEYFHTLHVGVARSVAWASGVHRRNGITQLKSLVFETSAGSPGLQLADLLCGRVRHALQPMAGGNKVAAPFSSDVMVLLSLLWGQSPMFAGITASSAFKNVFEERFARSIKA